MILILSGTTEGRRLAAALTDARRPFLATTVTTYGSQLLLKTVGQEPVPSPPSAPSDPSEPSEPSLAPASSADPTPLPGLAPSLAPAQRSTLSSATATASATATPSAASLLPSQLATGPLDQIALEALLTQHHITAVVDATHPYAQEITRLAARVAQKHCLPLLRWQRPGLLPEETEANPHLITCPDPEAAAKEVARRSGQWLLTTGSRSLPVFCSHVPLERLLVRVMPFPGVIRQCIDLGLTPGQIIAMQGPFSREMNRQFLLHTGAAGLVTKDSGDTGGTREKIQAAEDVKVPVILIQRPVLPPEVPQAATLEEVLAWTEKQLPPLFSQQDC
ncbi:precorrin-6A reductase [Anoxynatronum sibiricum]|uniref:Precorrin-6A reductase n=1 Tax=Anoxynatronum sibiricum TaxID=210623 RepID=A0ABU9VT95_9CLOT